MSEAKKTEDETSFALEPLKRDPSHIREIIKRVLTLEHERLYLRQPHLNDDIIKVIKEEVK